MGDPLGLFGGTTPPEGEGDPLGLFTNGKPKKEEPKELSNFDRVKDYASRGWSEGAAPALETIKRMATAAPSAIAALGQSTPEDIRHPSQGIHRAAERMSEYQELWPKVPGADPDATDTLGEGIDTLQQGAGSVVNAVSQQAHQQFAQEQGLNPQQMNPAIERQLDPVYRTLGEAASNFAPVPGLGPLARGVERIPVVGSVARGRAAGAREYGSWGQGMEPQAPPPPTTMRGPDQSGSMQPYLYADDKGIPNDARSPYNLPQSEIDRITEEIRQQTANPNQADMLSGFNPIDKFQTEAGGRGFRDTIPGADLDARGVRGTEGQFQPSLTDSEYTGPRQQGTPGDNSIAYAKYHPDDIQPLMEAESKPGFLQDAVDKVNLRFERVRQQEARTETGLNKLEMEVREARRNRGLDPLFTAEDITGAVPPLHIPAKVQRAAETKIIKGKFGAYTEYVPIETLWGMRDHNRLTDPKSMSQWEEKEASVLKNGINEPLEIKYSIGDKKAVLTNGHTRLSSGMKHGLDEVPVRVTVIKEPLSGTEAVNAVKVEAVAGIKPGDAKPSDIGIAGARAPRPDILDKGPGRKQRGGSQQFRLHPKNLTETIRRLNDADTGPLKETIKGVKAWEVRDVDSASGVDLAYDVPAALSVLGRNVGDARTIRMLNSEQPGLGRLYDQINKRIENLDRWAQNVKNDFLIGRKFTTKRPFDWRKPSTAIPTLRGFERRFGSEDGANSIWAKIKKMADSDQFAKAWNDADGKTDDIAWRSSEHRQLGQKLRSIIASVKDVVDEARADVGIEDKVSLTKGFFPRVRRPGDYILNAYDKNGTLAYSETFSNPFQARKVMKYVQDRPEFKDLRFDPVQHKNVVGKGATDVQAVIQARLAAGNNPELKRAFDQAIDAVVGRRGAGGHLMSRAADKISGYLGHDNNVKDMERAFNTYVENMVDYAANLKRRKVHQELESLRFDSDSPPDKTSRYNNKTGGYYKDDANKLQDLAPNAHHYLTEYILHSRGALQAMDQLDKAALGEVGRAMQLGENWYYKGAYKLSNFATMAFLTKAAFPLSQPFQTVNSIARIVKMRQELGGTYVPGYSEARAVYHYLHGLQRTVFPYLDDGARPAVNHATKAGYIDFNTQHNMDSTPQGVFTSAFTRVVGTVEREAVRIPTLLAMEDSLRDLIPDAQKRYEVATSNMFRSMAGTSKSNTPLIYNKMGPLGVPMKNMKSYGTNAFGQFAEYLQYAAQGASKGELKQLSPLFTHLGAMTLVGGINGLILMQEADATITLFNALTSSNWRTPQEWVLTGGASDWLTKFGAPSLAQDLDGFIGNHPNFRKVAGFGLASSIFGRDMQAQTSNPPATSLVDIIPLKLFWSPSGGGIVPAAVNYVVAAAQGQLTDPIRMKFYEAVTAGNPHARALIEQHFQQPGRTVPNPHYNMAGTSYRDDSEYFWTKMSGMRNLDEADRDKILGYIKRHEFRLEKDRNQTLNSAVDDMLDGGVTSDKVRRYIEAGGSPRQIGQDMKNTVKRRALPEQLNVMIQGAHSGLPYAKKMQEMTPYMEASPNYIQSRPGDPLDLFSKP